MLQVIILLGTYHFFQISILSAFYLENAVTVKQLLPVAKKYFLTTACTPTKLIVFDFKTNLSRSHKVMTVDTALI